MFVEERLDEVEVLVKEKRKADLQTAKFATLQGVKGKQFGREVYTTIIKFKDLEAFLTVFPKVQREVNKIKVGKIKTYILSGLEDSSSLRFFSAITCTCRGFIFYDELTGKIAIDTVNAKLSVNDGQHRFYSVIATLAWLRERFDYAEKDKHRRAELGRKIEELEEMIIPLVIFNQISEREEAQLFHDINNLAARPSRSATIRLAQTDLYAVAARELAATNKFISDYGVEYDKANIGQNNPNMILLTTIYAIVREFNKTRDSDFQHIIGLTEDNYKENLEYLHQFFNDVFRALPYDIQNKEVYILHKHFALKGIARFVKQCRESNVDEAKIFEAIKNVNWTADTDYWGAYGARMGIRTTKIVFPDGEKGIGCVSHACFTELNRLFEEDELGE